MHQTPSDGPRGPLGTQLNYIILHIINFLPSITNSLCLLPGGQMLVTQGYPHFDEKELTSIALKIK